MYDDNLTVANKIITDKDLEEIFQKIREEIEMCEKQYQREIAQNERFEREYQTWTVKDYVGKIHVRVNFYDDTEILFDKFNNFMNVFYNRLHEIKSFYVRYSCQYSRLSPGKKEEYVYQHISLDIFETRMNIEVGLDSDDQIMNQVYDLVKQKVLSAPVKYDRVIRKKSTIYNKVTFAIGFIPISILMFLLVFVEGIGDIYAMSYVGFPILCIIFSFIVGSAFFGGKLDKYYINIAPEKKYAGFDSTNLKSIYKDDIDKYVQTSEILIGKNINNLRNRQEILDLEKKYSSYLKYEAIALVIMSLLVVVIGKIM